MLPHSVPSGLAVRSRRRTGRTCFLAVAALGALSGPVILAGHAVRDDEPPIASPSRTLHPAPARNTAAVVVPERQDGALDPTPSLKPETLAFARNVPLEAAFRLPSVRPEADPAPPLPSAQKELAQPLPSPPTLEATRSLPMVPLPVPRPPEFRLPKASEPPQVASRPVSRRSRIAALPSAPADDRSFFEKLFGVRRAPGPALGYAALDGGVASVAPSTRLGPAPNPDAGVATAVYDISARVVYMPDGTRLEAHSGLGDKIDDPQYVHVRMRGATPPGTYDLTERERLFHGVRALRLNPIGGSAAIYGRAGLLAHTYMLGPNGDSNGCVSFKDYDKFLQAFLRGDVKRLVVVTGRGQDSLPRIVNNRTGSPQRSSLRASDS
jgi:Protein of unknown function (DUF2778)